METIALVSASGDGSEGGGGGGGGPDRTPPGRPPPLRRARGSGPGGAGPGGGPGPHTPSAAPAAAPAAAPPTPCGRPTPLERSTLKAAALVAPLWFGAQLAFNASLARTSVTSNTILSSASGLFTYGLSVLFLGEARSWGRLLSVLTCMAGTALVAGADALTGRAGRGGGGGGGGSPDDGPRPHPHPRSGLAGDGLALASSLLYAAYTVALRALLPADDEAGGGGGGDSHQQQHSGGGGGSAAATALFFGAVGVANLAVGAPVLGVGIGTGRMARAGAPPGAPLFTPRLLGAAVGKGLLDNVLSDFLWARAVLLVGPTVATVGLNVQVPLAAGLDAALRSPGWSRSVGGGLMTAAGAALVVAGVCGISAGPAAEVVAGVAGVEGGGGGGGGAAASSSAPGGDEESGGGDGAVLDVLAGGTAAGAGAASGAAGALPPGRPRAVPS